MQTYDGPREQIARGRAPDASVLDTVRWALAHAALAPSELNSQPWLFYVQLLPHGAAGLELTLDATYALPAVDPTGREGVLACGAALYNLRLALHACGLATAVRLCPYPDRPDVLADILVEGTHEEDSEQRELRLAVPLRRTHRGTFDPGGLPQEVIDRLLAEAGYEGAPATVLSDDEQAELRRLGADAAETLSARPTFRTEIAEWSRTNSSSRSDGVRGYSHGLNSWQAWLEPFRLRAGRSQVTDRERAEHDADRTPVVIAIGSADESRAALLRAGSAMQRLLLRATHLGVAASYQNAALHDPDARARLGRAVSLDHPQVVLRLGWGKGGKLSSRRDAAYQVVARSTH